MRKPSGFTLIELMIVVGIVAVISAIAIPMYTGYIETSRVGALSASIATMVVFQEDLRLRTGVYAAGTWDLAGGDDSLLTAVGWEPGSQDGTVYVVTLVAAGYQVRATDTSGVQICIEYPDRTIC